MLLLTAITLAPGGAFTPLEYPCIRKPLLRHPPPQLSAADPHGYEALHSLLIQRAVQSLCYTQKLSRDPISAMWLERFGGHAGMAQFHGIDGLRLPWRDYLSNLLHAPAERLIVESKLKRHRGLSSNNPFMQPTPMTYEHQVQPASIAGQLMAVALQIAAEWQIDLKRIEAENNELVQLHRDEVIDDSAAAAAAGRRMPAYEVNDGGGGSSSPHRAGNYDLLRTLLTRQALRQMVSDLRALPSRAHELAFLEKLAKRPELSFSGELPYRRAEAVIRKVLEAPFAMQLRADGKPQLLDPLLLADGIMERRAALAERWIETLSGGTPERAFLTIKQNWLKETLELDLDVGVDER